tara:strand:- start:917 stop:1105 length:189 start_codon:yes stop_codon:yes gene_type:complete
LLETLKEGEIIQITGAHPQAGEMGVFVRVKAASLDCPFDMAEILIKNKIYCIWSKYIITLPD